MNDDGTTTGRLRGREPLVMVPGLVCDAEVWHHQVRHLRDAADISIPAVDTGDTMEHMAEHVLASAPPRFALAGFSMGGYVALEVLRQAPERVLRLALLDTSARADTPEKSAGRRAAIDAIAQSRYRDVVEGMMPVLLHPDRQNGPLADLVRTMTDRLGPEVFARRHQAMLTRSDSRDLLRTADHPVRVICGRQDAMSTLAEHEEMADLAPRSRLSIIDECGHMSIIERPHAVSALLRDWLVYD
jgi:pimeloyl-ACP methyl ester carboxylesterase